MSRWRTALALWATLGFGSAACTAADAPAAAGAAAPPAATHPPPVIPAPVAPEPAAPAPATPAAIDSLEAWLARDPDCLAFSDGCQICVVSAGKPSCSTPGIACQPTGWQCRKKAAATPDSPLPPATKP